MILNFKSSLMKLLYIQNNNKRESSFQFKFQVNEHVWEYVQHRKSGYVWDAIILQYGRDGLIRPCFCTMDTNAPVGSGLFLHVFWTHHFISSTLVVSSGLVMDLGCWDTFEVELIDFFDMQML